MKFRHFFLLCITIFFGFVAGNVFPITRAVEPATSWNVFNSPPPRLAQGISTTQTEAITLSAPIRNGVKVVFPTTSGGVLHLRNARFEEDIYYASGSVNNNLDIRLYGVVRGFCWNLNTFSSCESGRQWAKGTETIPSNDFRLFNTALRSDRAIQMQGSGKILSGTGTAGINLGYMTLVERNAMTNVLNGDTVCVSTTALCYMRLGNAWIAVGTAAVPNATTTVAGRVTISTLERNISATGTGGGAVPVISTSLLTGANLHDVPCYGCVVTSATGGVTANMGGTGLSGAQSGTLLRPSGSGSFTVLAGDSTMTGWLVSWNDGNIEGLGHSGFVLVPPGLTKLNELTGSSTTLISPALVPASYQYLIGTGTILAGDRYWIHGAMDCVLDASDGDSCTIYIALKDGDNDTNTIFCQITNNSSTAERFQIVFDFFLNFDDADSSSVVDSNSSCVASGISPATTDEWYSRAKIFTYTGVNALNNVLIRPLISATVTSAVYLTDFTVVKLQ